MKLASTGSARQPLFDPPLLNKGAPGTLPGRGRTLDLLDSRTASALGSSSGTSTRDWCGADWCGVDIGAGMQRETWRRKHARRKTRKTSTTSTNLNYYTGQKLESKSHFYGRAAAEEVLASFYRALLRARSARRGFSTASYVNAARVYKKGRRHYLWCASAHGQGAKEVPLKLRFSRFV